MSATKKAKGEGVWLEDADIGWQKGLGGSHKHIVHFCQINIFFVIQDMGRKSYGDKTNKAKWECEQILIFADKGGWGGLANADSGWQGGWGPDPIFWAEVIWEQPLQNKVLIELINTWISFWKCKRLKHLKSVLSLFSVIFSS